MVLRKVLSMHLAVMLIYNLIANILFVNGVLV